MRGGEVADHMAIPLDTSLNVNESELQIATVTPHLPLGWKSQAFALQ